MEAEDAKACVEIIKLIHWPAPLATLLTVERLETKPAARH